MKQFTLYIGTDGAPAPFNIDHREAELAVAHIAGDTLNGYTLHHAIGAWKDDRGIVIHERSIVVTVLAGEGNRVWEFARAVRDALNQDCVLVTEQEVAATFVTARNDSRIDSL